MNGKKWVVIQSLRLVDFRCFEALTLEIPTEIAVFLGENAQGKTSLLEAICVLVRLQSPRTHRIGQLQRFQRDGFGVAGECWEQSRRVQRAGGELELQVDGERVESQGDYLSSGGLLVWMGNEDLELVRGPGEVRRRFLDFVAGQIDPGYRRHLIRYRRALKSRNLLLKDRQPDEEQVLAYTRLLVEHGEEIQRSRQELLRDLALPVAHAQERVGGAGDLGGISYDGSGFGRLAEAFEEVATKERAQGRTLIGPHRDDFILTLDGRSAADFGSEGQQRTMALALKLGQGRLLEKKRNAPPVYLIDDVFGELDPSRRNALMDCLPASSQKLITTTSLSWMDGEAPPLFKVVGGAVIAE